MYQGKLVRLRAFDNSDLMYALSMNNDYNVMRTASSAILYPTTVEDQARFIANQTSYSSGDYQFAIERLDNGCFIGQCGVMQINWKNRRAELGIMLTKEAAGKGFGTEAVSLLCKFAFDEMNLHKLKACVFSFNTPAIRCYEKCGFVHEGVLKDEVYREGQYHDACVMAKIKTEA
ncbi:MAG: GNAT family N-acetyltransferase [Clostridia bacterium]|nr:GNAT family N-acetyltransferase [Clostridia bacterium]MBR6810109.1 GNAT family N-acetyltransferase [Clostridia bacterium]